MFDDEPLKKTTQDFPRNLEGMSISDLEDYITALKSEITRVETDIKAKQASSEAAASAFKF